MADLAELDKELLSKSRFRRVFERLEQKAIADPYLLYSSPVFEDCPLSALLRGQPEFFRHCRKLILSDEFEWSSGVKVVLHERKDREIYVNSWPDRVVLMVLAQVLTERMPVGAGVYSFRKGGSHHLALQAFQKFLRDRGSKQPLYVFKRDIKKYGDSMNRHLLTEQLDREIPGFARSRFFRPLVLASFETRFRDVEGQAPAEALLTGIPAGSPLVPPLENFYLRELDQSLGAFEGAFYGRYGDDFVFASSELEVMTQARLLIESVVQKLDLKINREKSLDWALVGERTPSPTRADFTTTRYVEWLGNTLDAGGFLSCPPEQFLLIRNTVRSDLQRAFQKAKRISVLWPASDQERFLKSALRHITNVKKRFDLFGPLMVWQERASVRADFDRSVWASLVRNFRKILQVPRKSSLARARALRFKSLQSQFGEKKGSSRATQ